MEPPGGGVAGVDSDYYVMVGGIPCKLPCGESAPRDKDLITSEVLGAAHRSQGDHKSANSSNPVQPNNTEDLELVLHVEDNRDESANGSNPVQPNNTEDLELVLHVEDNCDESANASNLVQSNNTDDLESALLVEVPAARSKVSLDYIHAVVEAQFICSNCKKRSLGLPPVDEDLVIVRQLALNFKANGTGRRLDKALKRWGYRRFPGKFNKFRVASFSALVKKVVEDDDKHLLNALREVARTFIPMGRIKGLSWSPEIGEQHFTLCVRNVVWNRENFHPNLESKMDAIKVLALEGAYKFEGVDVGEGEPDRVDVGKFVVEVLIKNQWPAPLGTSPSYPKG